MGAYSIYLFFLDFFYYFVVFFEIIKLLRIGRLALIIYGPCEGRMCTIVDIVGQKRVVLDGPE